MQERNSPAGYTYEVKLAAALDEPAMSHCTNA